MTNPVKVFCALDGDYLSYVVERSLRHTKTPKWVVSAVDLRDSGYRYRIVSPAYDSVEQAMTERLLRESEDRGHVVESVEHPPVK